MIGTLILLLMHAFFLLIAPITGGIALLGGLLLTTIIFLLILQVKRQRDNLELQIENRTEELRISEQNFRTFFETMDDMIFISDRNGKIFYANNTVFRKLGYSMEDLNGMHVLDVHPADKKQEAGEIFGEMFAGRRDYCPLPLATKDGTYVPVETRIWFGTWDGKDCIFVISKDLSKEQASLQKFNKIFDSNPALMAITSVPERIFTEVNDTFIEKTGFSRAELIGKTAAELDLFIENDKQQRLAESMEQDGFIHEVELKMKTKSGEVLDGLFSGEILESQGKRYSLTVMIDITERRRVEENLKETRDRLTLAIKAGNIGVWEYDVIGNTETWDTQMYSLYGMGQARFENASTIWRAGIHPDDLARQDDEILKAVNGEKDYDSEFRIFWPDGSEHHIRAMALVQRDFAGKALRMIGTNWDITAQKGSEAELKATNRYLIDATARANDLMLQADAANRAKSNFLSTMSHEIRTPMNGVIGMTGLLLETPLNAEQKQYAQIIRTSGEALLTLINDILDFSKIEAGKIELENMDFHLRVTLEDTVDILAVKAKEKGLRLVNNIDPDVYEHLRGDPGRLRQILINLTGNAIKFTSTGSVVLHTALESETDRHETLRFEIIDTGIGIPPEKQKTLFSPFTQVDSSTSRKYGGTGLGLAISKQLTELMGGTIGITSQEGEGSTFFFTAVFEKREAGKLADTEMLANLTDLNILVVDDKEADRLLVTSLLTGWGCRYKEAYDGASALVLLEKEVAIGKPFDIALLDMQMPNMDGAELGNLIRNNPLLRSTRLVMLTAIEDSGAARRFAALGFSGYLTKPLRQKELRNCLSLAAGHADTQFAATKTGSDSAANEPRKAIIRILLAEDNMTNQLVALKILEKFGYRADVAANGLEVLDALQHLPYDLVLMDCQMPEMDGYEATRKIRRREAEGSRIPIIAMTANALQGDREKCLEAGMDDYLSKPVDPEKMRAMIARWIPAKNGESEEIEELETADNTDEIAAPVFDKKGYRSRIMEDDSFGRILIEAFLSDMPQQIETLELAIVEGDALRAGKQAHKIKGAAANMGGEAMREIARQMEEAGKADNQDMLLSLLPTLRNTFEVLVPELKAF